MIIPSFSSEMRAINNKHVYTCPICAISYGYIKDDLSMNLETECIACKFNGRVSEFIPDIIGAPI